MILQEFKNNHKTSNPIMLKVNRRIF